VAGNVVSQTLWLYLRGLLLRERQGKREKGKGRESESEVKRMGEMRAGERREREEPASSPPNILA